MSTLVHLPFVVNTRLRSSLIDPIIAILSGIGWAAQSNVVVRRES